MPSSKFYAVPFYTLTLDELVLLYKEKPYERHGLITDNQQVVKYITLQPLDIICVKGELLALPFSSISKFFALPQVAGEILIDITCLNIPNETIKALHLQGFSVSYVSITI